MRKIITISAMLIFLILLLPIPSHQKESSITSYTAVLYKITQVNKLNEKDSKDRGIIIEFLGHIIYNGIEIFPTEEENLKSIENEDGLIFTISRKDKSCTPFKLAVYDDKKYELYTSYEACKPFSTCNMMLKYYDKETGMYEYDIYDIIKDSKKIEDKQLAYTPMYEIYTGNGDKYVTGSNNENLNRFLKSINVDLNKCAKKIYK